MRGEEEILTERRKEGVTHTTWEQGGQGKEGTSEREQGGQRGGQ